MKTFKAGEIPDLDYEYAVKKPIQIRCIPIDEAFEIETLEGILKGKKGDYLMIGIQGEMYPCSKEIFEETYLIVNPKK
ncbi:hypothetical protein ACTHGU_20075 [Chitinophagaceae bacterium MMS25-I14]